MTREVVDEGQGRVEVWAKTTKFDARRRYEVEAAGGGGDAAARVARLDEAARSIKEVVDRHRGEHLHLLAHGKRWSFDEVVTCQDGILETHDRLSQFIDATRGPGGVPNHGLLFDALSDDVKAEGVELAYVEAGIEIEKLMHALDPLGLALPTAGSSSGQSLAGLLNTGSHGSEFDMPPLPDMIRAVAIVCPDGVIRWVEPSAGVTSDGMHASLLPSAEVLRDDDAFSAAMVTVGALGVIVAYVIEVRLAYGLWETIESSNWQTTRALIGQGGAFFDAPADWWMGQPLDPAATYRAGEVLINPFRDPHTHERNVLLMRRAERDTITAELKDWERTDWKERAKIFWTSFKALVKTLSEDVDDYGPTIDTLLRTGREETMGFAPAHEVLNFGNRRMERVWSIDVVLPTTDDVHLDFIDEVLARYDTLISRDLKMAGFLALRFSKRTRASLGMQNDNSDDPAVRFAQLELFLLQAPFDLRHFDLWREKKLVQDGVQFYEAFRDLAQEYHRRGKLRFHWGQLVRDLPSFAPPDDAVLARWHEGRKALVGDAPYLFANALMMEAGVIEPPEGFELDGVLPRGAGDKLATDHRRAVLATPPTVSIDGVGRIFAVDGHARVSERAGLDGWRALRPRDGVDDDESPAGRLVSGTRKTGRACVVARDEEGQLRSTIEEKPQRWSDWDRVDRDVVGDPALVKTDEGLELFAVSEHGLERWREDGDDDWDQLDRIGGSAELVGSVAVARVDGRTLILGRRADDTVVLHRVGSAGWQDAGGSSSREPALLRVGDRALAVWLTADGRLAARLFDAQLAPVGAVRTTATQPSLSSLGGIHLSERAGEVRVAIADPEGRVRVYRYDVLTGGWGAEEVFSTIKAIGGPVIFGDLLLVKVAHDIVVRRTLS